MSFIGKTEGLRKEAGRFVRRYGRVICAVVLCVCMVVSGFPSVFFKAFASDDDADYYYELERESLWESLVTAVDEGTMFDKELEFYGEYADEYDELFEADGTLYELKNLGYKKDSDRDKVLDLRVFARVEDNIPTDSYYEVSGDEQIIFLLTNMSNDTVTVTIYVDELETEIIEVVSASEVGGVIVETAFDALKTDAVVTSAEHSAVGSSDRVESASDAVSGFDVDDVLEQVASLSLKRSNIMSAALDLSDEISDSYNSAVIASANNALRDDSAPGSSGSAESHVASGSDVSREFIDGYVYDAVRIDSKYSAVAFVTTAEDLGLDGFGIPLLQRQTILADIYEDASYDVMAADDMEIILSGLMPVDAEVKAYPVDVEIEGFDVIAAYDIAIFDSDDDEFEPDDEIEVEMNSDEIRETLGEDADLHIYHMEDINANPEEVSVISSDDGIVTFMADRFSVYVLASEIMPLAAGDTAFAVYSATDNSLTFYADTNVPTAGDTYNGKTVTNVYTEFDTGTYSSYSSVPWYSNRTNIRSVVFDESFQDVKPESMAYWFYGFTDLTDIDAADLDTSKVTTLRSTFQSCSSLTNVAGLANWDTSNVTTLYYTFRGCSNLTNVDGLANWNTSNVTNMSYMFSDCNSLITINVSNWDTSKVTDMSRMFEECTTLRTIYSDNTNFVTTSVTSGAYMFFRCYSLVGGNGTKYSSDNTTYQMAHVDGGESNPGYFAATSGLEIYKYTGDNVYEDSGWNDQRTGLAGAEFELKDGTDADANTAWFAEDVENVYTFVNWSKPDDSGDYTQTLVSGSAGMIYVYNLDAGTYYLYETKAPSGYAPLTEPVMVVVTANGTARVEIQNNIRTLLPYTGGPGTVIFEILGVLLMGSALMLFMIQKRRRRLTE